MCTYILIGLEAKGEASRVDCLNESKKMNNFPFGNSSMPNDEIILLVNLFSCFLAEKKDCLF